MNSKEVNDLDIIFIIGIITIALLFFLQVKNSVTAFQHKKISNAIFEFRVAHFDDAKTKDLVRYSDMEPYETTLFRLWDFGNKNILPKWQYDLIKKYL